MKVNLFLDLGDDVGPTPFLTIPQQDINRLFLSPYSWLRFVLFAICGAHGTLSAMPRGSSVEAELSELYIYTPSETVSL